MAEKPWACHVEYEFRVPVLPAHAAETWPAHLASYKTVFCERWPASPVLEMFDFSAYRSFPLVSRHTRGDVRGMFEYVVAVQSILSENMCTLR